MLQYVSIKSKERAITVSASVPGELVHVSDQLALKLERELAQKAKKCRHSFTQKAARWKHILSTGNKKQTQLNKTLQYKNNSKVQAFKCITSRKSLQFLTFTCIVLTGFLEIDLSNRLCGELVRLVLPSSILKGCQSVSKWLKQL